MTLTFGIATAAGRPRLGQRGGRGLRQRGPVTGATPETITVPWAGRSTTTWVTTPTAGTRRASAARRPATWTITRPPSWATACARPRGDENGRGGSHARTSSTQQVAPAELGPGRTGTHRTLRTHLTPRGAPAPGSRSRPGAPAAAGPARPPGAYRRAGRPEATAGPRVKVKGSWWRHWTWRKALGVAARHHRRVHRAARRGGGRISTARPRCPPSRWPRACTPSPWSTPATGTPSSAGSAPRTGRCVSYSRSRPRSSTRCWPPRTATSSTRAASRRPASCAPPAQDTTGGGNFQGGSTITQQFVRNYYQGIGTSQTAQPEDQRDLRRDEGRQAEVQAVDPGELPQHDLPRPRRLRRRRRGADVLRQAGGQASTQLEPGRGDRRHDPAAEHLPAAAVPGRA